MSKLMSFIVYNIIVYVLYGIMDALLTAINVYSNPNLGTDLLIMPTDKDMGYIIINIVISSTLGYVLLKKLKQIL